MSAFNPYAPPKAALEDALEGECWRDGRDIVLRRPPAFPPRCVKCNAPADGEAARRKLRWGNLLTLYYRTAEVQIPLCHAHAGRYRRLNLAFQVLRRLNVLLFVFIFIAPTFIPDAPPVMRSVFPWLLPAFFVSVLANTLLKSLAQPLSPRRIDNDFIRLRGAGKDFLDSLPEFPGR